jgi:hypothetical protein
MTNQYHVVEATPTVDTNVYASGDRVGTLMTLTGVGEAGAGCRLDKVVIVDKSKQKSALKIYLFNASPTIVSADNAAADISDAEMAAKCVGVVSVVAGDYHDLANNSTADTTYGKPLKAPGATLYALIVSAGTPTYTSTTDLVLKFHFSWE